MMSISYHLLERRNQLGWDFYGTKHELCHRLLRSRFEGFSDKAKLTAARASQSL
jgi:hypothetical protein